MEFYKTLLPPCWCSKPILWELNSLPYVHAFFCSNKLTYRCWSREWNVLFLVCDHVTRWPCGGSIQYNFFSNNLHENRVSFPEESNAFVLDHQHGRRDVTCKPAILCTFVHFLVAFCLLHSMGKTWNCLLWRLVEDLDRRGRNSNRTKSTYIYPNWVSYNNRSQRTRDMYLRPNGYLSNRKRFPCLHSLI